MYKHGETSMMRSPEYVSWSRMRQSCSNPKTKNFHRYGGRGISVCKRWEKSFDAFLKDMGRRPSLFHSIDRKNNNKGYTPSNCKWATKKEQARNRSTNRVVGGKTIVEWAEKNHMLPSTLASRLNKNMSLQEAIVKPLRKTKRHDVEIGKQKQRVATVAKNLGIAPSTAYSRLKHGWTTIDAVTKRPGSDGVGRRPHVTITIHGETKTLAAWAERTGIKENTIRERLRLHPGWSSERVLTPPTIR
jgi:hypothetical protein